MTADRIMAIQDRVLNWGRSSSRPRRSRPYGLTARPTRNTKMPSALSR